MRLLQNRLYEIQVKKIIKVQSMMRAFLAKRNVTAKLVKMRSESGKQSTFMHVCVFSNNI